MCESLCIYEQPSTPLSGEDVVNLSHAATKLIGNQETGWFPELSAADYLIVSITELQ